MRMLTVFNILAVALLFLSVGMVVVPDAESRHTIATEVSTVRALQRVAVAQHALLASGAVDTDGNGRPEFGSLPELARRFDLPLGELSPDGTASLAGGSYRIAVLLPGTDGRPLPPDVPGERDAAFSERTFLAVAWPVEPGRGARRAYAVHHSLLVHEHPNEDLHIQGDGFPSIRLPRLAHRDRNTGRVTLSTHWPAGWALFLDDAQARVIAARLTRLGLAIPDELVPRLGAP